MTAKSGGDGFGSGKTTGLSVSAFWTKLFDRNFKAKKTDKQLKAEFSAEFPKRTGGPAVALLRSWYNRGQQNYGAADEKQRPDAKRSTAYDKKGQPTAGDWGDKAKKKNKKLSALARERALKTWRKKKKAAGTAPAKVPAAKPAKAVKGKAASKPAAKVKSSKPAGGGARNINEAANQFKKAKSKPAPAGKPKPAPDKKSKFKLKSSK